MFQKFKAGMAFAVILALPALLPARQAAAVVFTDPAAFDAAHPGLALDDFEGIAPRPDRFTDVSTFSGGTITGNVPIAAPRAVCGTQSDVVGVNATRGTLNFGFTAPVTAAGLNLSVDAENCGVGGINGTLTVEVLLGAIVLATEEFTPLEMSSISDGSFRGFSGLGAFDTLRVTANSTLDVLLVDNLRFGSVEIPEPGTLTLLGAGLFGLASARRRRKAA